jgi:hypothetical protein
MMALRRNGLAGALLLVLLIVAAALPGSQPALIAASPDLFSPADSQPAAGGEPAVAARDAGRGVLRSRLVEVDFDRLAAAAASPNAAEGTLVLNLFDDVILTALPERVTTNPPHGFAWSGRIQGVELSQVTLVVRDGVLAANVATPGAMYQVRPAGGGVHVVRQIDQAAFPQEMEPIPVELPSVGPATDLAEPADDGSMIDVLVVYTPVAAAWAGSILAEIDLAVQETNDSYTNSGITQRVRLVHAAQVSYAQSGNISTDLSRLQGTTDPYMNEVHSLRNTYGADEVVLLVSYPSSDYCGVAYMMSSVSSGFEAWAFAVVDVDCATGYYSFGHEMGHNMGARHDWYVDSAATPYGHAHGYLSYANPVDRWRSVMAYNDECAAQGVYCWRIPYWSNPSVLRNGVAMGVPEGTSTACVTGSPHPYCDADNRKTLNKTAYTVANFRASVLPPVQVGPVAYVRHVVDDDNLGGSSGNGDGRIDCGETIQLYVDLQNVGDDLADNVLVTLSTSSPYVTWLDNQSSYGDIAPGAMVRNSADAFDLQVSASTPHGQVIQFNLSITAANGGPWSDSFVTSVRCGGSAFTTYLPLAARSYVAGFNSQFNGSAAGWQPHAGSWQIESDLLYATEGVPGAWASTSYSSTYHELDYQARVWRQGCSTCAHGLLVRGSPEPLRALGAWDSGYGFYIARDGYYAIYSYSGGSSTELQPWTSSTAIHQGDIWNELRVVANGSRLAFYINGGLVWIGNNAAHASGRVGLAMARDPSSSGNKLWVDWATLVPEAPALDPGELSAEQRALNEAAWQEGAPGSDGRTPDR